MTTQDLTPDDTNEFARKIEDRINKAFVGKQDTPASRFALEAEARSMITTMFVECGSSVVACVRCKRKFIVNAGTLWTLFALRPYPNPQTLSLVCADEFVCGRIVPGTNRTLEELLAEIAR